MRAFSPLFILLASAYAMPGQSPSLLSPEPVTALALRSSHEEIGHLYEKRFFDLLWNALEAVASPVKLVLGVYAVVSSVFTVKDKCKETTFDCLIGTMDVIAAVYCNGYDWYDGISSDAKRSLEFDGLPVYKSRTFMHRNLTFELHAHIPMENGTTLGNTAHKTNNNGTWHRIATAVYPNNAKKHVMYRLAAQEDLGKENDGTYHHLRVQPPSLSSLARRIEEEEDGLVSDYLYNNNNGDVWESFTEIAPDDVGATQAEWMEGNNAEASCMVPGEITSDGSLLGADHGVAAYGWNGSPFDFAGRAGGWVDNCRAVNE